MVIKTGGGIVEGTIFEWGPSSCPDGIFMHIDDHVPELLHHCRVWHVGGS